MLCSLTLALLHRTSMAVCSVCPSLSRDIPFYIHNLDTGCAWRESAETDRQRETKYAISIARMIVGRTYCTLLQRSRARCISRASIGLLKVILEIG